MVLCNFMKNLEKKMNELFQITSSAKGSEMKGEPQLKDLNEAFNFISTKFDESEKERKQREQIINNLEENVFVMNKKVESRKSNKGFFQQKNLKGSNVSNTECLTRKPMVILKKARIEYGFTNVWTSDGRILYKSSPYNKVKLYYESH